MNRASLTAKYRPQTFAQVAGQETVKAVLSRASLEQRVAPAYLFSGTRGVGKTTLARIFAKALNCRNSPTAEPCNECDQCRAITLGNAVDVVEIDGASNRGIDDVRRLKEVVGYAPMEGGYKIFIIDEAHMLSREAFNALLKTLEEPPAGVTFIMATTEPHKFPATIISRCQHYVFKPLSENGLVQHLSEVLRNESVVCEESALRLIARRGAGSVRDSMSLLGQVLALGEDTITESSTRNILGLAGQEAFLGLLEAFKRGDSLAISNSLRAMLEQGLDMGFFLRELASLWRTLFILRQSGKEGLGIVDLPEAEALRYLELSEEFSLAHIHACWQMTLDGQRRVLMSLEPALALELLLLNLGMLPKILSLEKISALERKASSDNRNSAPAAARPMPGGTQTTAGYSGGYPSEQKKNEPLTVNREDDAPRAPASHPIHTDPPAKEAAPSAEPEESFGEAEVDAAPPPDGGAFVEPPETGLYAEDEAPLSDAENAYPEEAAYHNAIADSAAAVAPVAVAASSAAPVATTPVAAPAAGQVTSQAAGQMSASDSSAFAVSEIPAERTSGQASADALSFQNGYSGGNGQGAASLPEPGDAHDSETAPPLAEGTADAATAETASLQGPEISQREPEWESIFALCAERESAPWVVSLMHRVDATWENGRLLLKAHDPFAKDRLTEPSMKEEFETLLAAWCGRVPEYSIDAAILARKTRDELKQEVMEHPLVKAVQEECGGYVIDFGQIR